MKNYYERKPEERVPQNVKYLYGVEIGIPFDLLPDIEQKAERCGLDVEDWIVDVCIKSHI